MVLEIFKVFPHYKSLGAKDHQNMANLDPGSMVGRIYVGDHHTLLYTKYISCGPHGSSQDFLKVFFPL